MTEAVLRDPVAALPRRGLGALIGWGAVLA